MTRKRLKKLLMGKGWSRKSANEFTNTVKWIRRIGAAPDMSYDGLYQHFIVCGEMEIILPF